MFMTVLRVLRGVQISVSIAISLSSISFRGAGTRLSFLGGDEVAMLETGETERVFESVE